MLERSMQISNIKFSIKIKKGFTMIEVLCSICIFIMLFTTAFKIQLNVFKMQKYNKSINDCTYTVESIKNNMIYNLSYDDILKLDSNNMKYIEVNNFLKFNYTSDNILNLFSPIKPKGSYIEINIEKGEILKIKLKSNQNSYGINRVRECEFYKGNFER
ncbi:hypothetical protein KM800_04650 [Clostridium tyrobutyricum]|nr:hypothetical protein [Clostridium tyrobutyricum]